MERPPLDEVRSAYEAVIAAEGITTLAGAVTGDSIFDAGLIGAGANSFFSMLIVVYPGQPLLVDSMYITGFDNITGEVTFDRAYKGVAAAIPAGVPYKIITFRFVPAEVAAIEAKLDLPAPDAILNTRIAEAAGNKASTAIYAKTATADPFRYLKGLMDAGIAIAGTVADVGPAITDFNTSLAAANNFYNGGLMVFVAGALATQPGHLVDVFLAANGNCAFAASDQWTVAPANGDAFLIIPNVGAYLKKIFTAMALAATALSTAQWTNALATALGLDSAPTAVGKSQIKATTVDLAQVGGTVVDLFTGTTQDVVVEKLVIRMSGGTLVGSNLTSILIQTDDATPIVLIDIVAGAVINLTDEAQLAWTGAILLDAGTGAKIRITLNGGAATAAKICDVIAECRAVVAGGYLA